MDFEFWTDTAKMFLNRQHLLHIGNRALNVFFSSISYALKHSLLHRYYFFDRALHICYAVVRC